MSHVWHLIPLWLHRTGGQSRIFCWDGMKSVSCEKALDFHPYKSKRTVLQNLLKELPWSSIIFSHSLLNCSPFKTVTFAVYLFSTVVRCFVHVIVDKSIHNICLNISVKFYNILLSDRAFLFHNWSHVINYHYLYEKKGWFHFLWLLLFYLLPSEMSPCFLLFMCT